MADVLAADDDELVQTSIPEKFAWPPAEVTLICSISDGDRIRSKLAPGSRTSTIKVGQHYKTLERNRIDFSKVILPNVQPYLITSGRNSGDIYSYSIAINRRSYHRGAARICRRNQCNGLVGKYRVVGGK